VAVPKNRERRILIRQGRRPGVKHRAGLEGELVVGDVRGLQPAGDAHVGERLLERLFRQRVHQIQIEVGEPGRMQLLGRAIRILRRMDAPQPHERRGSEALRPSETRVMPASR